MTRLVPAVVVAVLVLCAQAQAWKLTNVGKVETLVVELQTPLLDTSAFGGEVKPGASTSCPWNKKGCTSKGGGSCDKKTTLAIYDDGALADTQKTVTGYNGGVFFVSDDKPDQGPYLTYCWIGPCKGPDVNHDGSKGIPHGTKCQK